MIASLSRKMRTQFFQQFQWCLAKFRHQNHFVVRFYSCGKYIYFIYWFSAPRKCDPAQIILSMCCMKSTRLTRLFRLVLERGNSSKESAEEHHSVFCTKLLAQVAGQQGAVLIEIWLMNRQRVGKMNFYTWTLLTAWTWIGLKSSEIPSSKCTDALPSPVCVGRPPVHMYTCMGIHGLCLLLILW